MLILPQTKIFFVFLGQSLHSWSVSQTKMMASSDIKLPPFKDYHFVGDKETEIAQLQCHLIFKNWITVFQGSIYFLLAH